MESKLKLWPLIPGFFIGAFLLWFSTVLIMNAPLGATLKCLKFNKTCSFHHLYLWPRNDMVSFSFSEVRNIYPVLEHGAKFTTFSYLNIELTGSTIQIGRPSDYIARKEIPKLYAYLASPHANEMVLNQNINPFIFLFLIGSFLLGAAFSCIPILILIKLMQRLSEQRVSL